MREHPAGVAIQNSKPESLGAPIAIKGPYKPLWIDFAVLFYIYYMADRNGYPAESVICTKGRDIQPDLSKPRGHLRIRRHFGVPDCRHLPASLAHTLPYTPRRMLFGEC